MPCRSADKQSSSGAKWLFITIAVSLVCSSVTIAAYDRFLAQKIVTVDLAACIASQKEDYAAGRITAGELVENIETLLRRMENKKRNEVLVLEEAVAGDVRHHNLRSAARTNDEKDEGD